MRQTIAGVLVAGVALLQLCGCVWQEAKFRETRELAVEHVSGSGLDVQSANGSISVEDGASGQVEIDATIRAISQERLEAVQIVASRRDNGTLVLRAVWPEPGRRGSEGVSYVIRMPEVGAVDLSSRNGALKVVRARGAARLHTSNGAITVQEVGGPVVCETSNGSITITMAHASVEADTSNGSVDVSLAPDSSGPVRIDTSNGAVRLTVGKAFTGILTGDTSNGRIRLEGVPQESVRELGKRSCTLQFGEGTQKSIIDTSNGSITIVQQGSS